MQQNMRTVMPMEKVINASSVATYTTSGTIAAFGAITLTEWVLIIGIVISVLTFVVNLVYQQRRYRLEAEYKALLREELLRKLEADGPKNI